MHERDLLPSEYQTDDDLESRYVPDPDPVSASVGSSAFMTRYVVEECVERFPETPVARFPETFDRYYFDTPHGRILVDVLQDGTPEQLDEERGRKRVTFKALWCEENGWQYLPLPESDALNTERVRALLADGPATNTAESQPASRPVRKPRRGQVQRPKAAA